MLPCMHFQLLWFRETCTSLGLNFRLEKWNFVWNCQRRMNSWRVWLEAARALSHQANPPTSSTSYKLGYQRLAGYKSNNQIFLFFHDWDTYQLPLSIGLQITKTYTCPVKNQRLLYWEIEVLWSLAQSRDLSWAHSEILDHHKLAITIFGIKLEFHVAFWLWSLY